MSSIDSEDKPHTRRFYQPVMAANIEWHANVPRSRQFNDIYFNPADGLAESEAVFLTQNRLQTRFAALPPRGHFVIAETGFGTGLNFLLACDWWQRFAPTDAHLHFFSCEKFPLLRDDLQRALAPFGALQRWASALIEHYPLLVPDWHYLRPAPRIHLNLFLGDVGEFLQEIDLPVNAWFLDGFAPALNPDMWLEQRYRQMTAHSARDATVATFTAAGHVRRGLTDAGFMVSKVPGFGQKREMITAQLRPHLGFAHALRSPMTASVVGTGLAGAHVAHLLAETGTAVTVLEKGSTIAPGASGNPVGLQFARLSHDRTRQNRCNAEAYVNAIYHYQRLHDAADTWRVSSGLVQLAWDEREAIRQERILACGAWSPLVQSLQALTQTHAGWPLAITGLAGLYFPFSNAIRPAALCKHLLDHHAIRVHTNVDAFAGSSTMHPGVADDVRIVCAAWETNSTLQQPLPIKPSRGQISAVRPPAGFAESQVAVCHDGYVVNCDGRTWLGATYEMGVHDLHCSDAKQQQHHDANREQLSKLGLSSAGEIIATRIGIRCHSNHYLPFYGYDNSGLYYLTGLGSRGLVYAPYYARRLWVTLLTSWATHKRDT